MFIQAIIDSYQMTNHKTSIMKGIYEKSVGNGNYVRQKCLTL